MWCYGRTAWHLPIPRSRTADPIFLSSLLGGHAAKYPRKHWLSGVAATTSSRWILAVTRRDGAETAAKPEESLDPTWPAQPSTPERTDVGATGHV